MPTETAIAMIQDHGNFAALTCDGLLATSIVVDTTLEDDRVFEEPIVFDVNEGGLVCRDSVLIWLGY